MTTAIRDGEGAVSSPARSKSQVLVTSESPTNTKATDETETTMSTVHSDDSLTASTKFNISTINSDDSSLTISTIAPHMTPVRLYSPVPPVSAVSVDRNSVRQRLRDQEAKIIALLNKPPSPRASESEAELLELVHTLEVDLKKTQEEKLRLQEDLECLQRRQSATKEEEDKVPSRILFEEEELCLEDLYKLDYEIEPIAAGGEVLKAGLHVYMECNMYQHHAIVLDTSTWTAAAAKSSSEEPSIWIAEFTNAVLGEGDMIQSSSTASGAVSGGGVEGGFQLVEESNPSQWHVVKYQANPLERMTWRPGTCSGARPSPMETVLARVQFLHDCRHLIPDYHLFCSNCETVACWCVTGKWETLQGSGLYKVSKLGALAAAGVVAAPVGIAAGVAAGGLAAWHEFQVNQKWQKTQEKLNREFQWYALGKAPKFVLARSS